MPNVMQDWSVRARRISLLLSVMTRIVAHKWNLPVQAMSFFHYHQRHQFTAQNVVKEDI